MEIIEYPNPILEQVSIEIEDISKYEHTLLEMKDFILRNPKKGTGLALPQVGISKRAFVFRMKRGQVEIAINPVILEKGKIKVAVPYEELCLSIPGERKFVRRHYKIVVTYTTITGENRIKTLKGLSAKVFQHEFEHLEGILIKEKRHILNKVAALYHRKFYLNIAATLFRICFKRNSK